MAAFGKQPATPPGVFEQVGRPIKTYTRADPKKPLTPESLPDINILDIRKEAIEIDLKAEIIKQLNPEHGPKQLPTLLLYDEKGLQLFEEVCCSG